MWNSGTVKGIVGKLDVDNGARVYTMDAKIHVEQKGKSATYRPTVNLTIPDWKNLQIVGSVTYKDMESVDSDLQITGATESPINVTG
ncbi:hypothetical protein DPMN_105041 [Dreissena polymorpha]|uniref:Uncharacterized protein n=1 Tax=Dreissena polymorpha TaxID=45954 RepID=A0A9D4K1K1_DREPO|nr:hypothetical protein DPMN_105041 [Dreissena polymorpha]